MQGRERNEKIILKAGSKVIIIKDFGKSSFAGCYTSLM